MEININKRENYVLGKNEPLWTETKKIFELTWFITIYPAKP